MKQFAGMKLSTDRLEPCGGAAEVCKELIKAIDEWSDCHELLKNRVQEGSYLEGWKTGLFLPTGEGELRALLEAVWATMYNDGREDDLLSYTESSLESACYCFLQYSSLQEISEKMLEGIEEHPERVDIITTSFSNEIVVTLEKLKYIEFLCEYYCGQVTPDLLAEVWSAR